VRPLTPGVGLDIMDRFGRVVQEGRWRYGGTVAVAVRIRESDTRFGSGDHEDPPEGRDDRSKRCYYVDWDAAGTKRFSSISGPFDTINEAAAFVAQHSSETLRWTS
jgi:hypothetical protein